MVSEKLRLRLCPFCKYLRLRGALIILIDENYDKSATFERGIFYAFLPQGSSRDG